MKLNPTRIIFFSITLFKLEFLQKFGFSITLTEQSVNCLALVPFGFYLTSLIGYNIYRKLINNIITFTPYGYFLVIGLLLSNDWLSLSNSTATAVRLGFQQGMLHFPYFWFIFTILSYYCSSYSYLTFRTA